MPSALLKELLPLKPNDLMDYLRQGHPIDPDALDGKAYLGVSLGLPSIIDKVAWKTFQKAFKRDESTGELRGWNVRLEQHGVDAPPVAKRKRGKPITFGHFKVVGCRGRNMPRGSDSGLLIDYGIPGKPMLEMTRFLRDPIVAIEADDPSVLFGWSYLELGARTVHTPSFFLLSQPVSID